MSRLVRSAAQVEANAVRFQSELYDPKLQKRLAYARAWYAFPDSEGGWLYVPSKFGGYRDMTAAEYLDGMPRDGRRTEKQLGQWFVEVPEDSDFHAELYEGLVDFLQGYSKAPSTKARISVSVDVYQNYTDEEHSSSEDSALVDLILLVARKLPTNERARLRNAL